MIDESEAEFKERMGRMASETKWTPGPWKLDGHEVWSSYSMRLNSISAGTPLIATAARHDDVEGGFPYQANARLIAAAPDLYEALVSARSQLESYELAATGESFNDPQINAALRKARGE